MFLGESRSLTWLMQSTLDSAVGQLLFNNPGSAGDNQESRFDIIHRVRSQDMLKIVEAITIKFSIFALCRQKVNLRCPVLVLEEH